MVPAEVALDVFKDDFVGTVFMPLALLYVLDEFPKIDTPP